MLRGGHETFVHPLAEVRAEPLARQLSTKLPFFAFFVDQGTCGRELNAEAGVALVIDNLPIVLPPRMVSGKDLAQLTDFIPTELTAVDQIEQLALLVGDCCLFAIEHDEVRAGHRRRIRFGSPMYAVGIGNRCHELPRLEPVPVEHRLACIGGAHDDVRTSHHSFWITHGLHLDIQEFRHLLGKSIAMFFRHAIYFHLFYGTDRTDRFQVSARLVTRTKDPDDFGIPLRQSAVGHARGSPYANRRKTEVMNQRQWLASLQTEQKHEPPTTLQRRWEIHPFASRHDSLLHDSRIITQRGDAGTRYRAGNNVRHVAGFVEIGRHLVARSRLVDCDAARLLGKSPFHRVDAIAHRQNLPNFWIGDQQHLSTYLSSTFLVGHL